MKPIHLVLSGSRGRMGQEVTLLAHEDRRVISICPIEDATLEKESRKRIVVDFTSPRGLVRAMEFCQKTGSPLVSGTTGFGPAARKKLESLARRVPVLWAPNMSIGIAVMRKMISSFGELKNFDFQIEETHHRNKKDAPSGTALLLQQDLETTLGRRVPRALSIRGGGVAGDHTIWALGTEEVLRLEHRALNRAVFARGALVAAHWVGTQKPGLYTMSDVIG